MQIGYARVSTQDQNPDLQLDALSAAGCDRVFTEKASGAQRDRPELQAALDYMREGDTLVVWRLDRLARSLKQLISTVEDLEARGIGFRSLTEAVDTTTNGGRLVFHIFAALADEDAARIDQQIEQVCYAEALGFSDVWLTEHYFTGESIYNDAVLFCATMSLTWASSATSQATASASPPASSIARAVSSAVPGSPVDGGGLPGSAF